MTELTGGARTRARILDAAAALLGSVGITRTTTKEIARAAGCSEAALYKHFRDKEEIFVRVLRERAPRLPDVLAELPGQAGAAPLAERLTEVARVAVAFYRRSFPMAAGLLADPDLLAAHRRRLAEDDVGPQEPTRRLTDYLREEQRLGYLAPSVDPAAAAALLIGACFHRAFLEMYFADEAPEGAARPASTEDFAAGIAVTLLRAVAATGSPDRRPAPDPTER